MDMDLWHSTCRSLNAARRHFEVPAGAGHGSSLNNDGTPYQVALALAGNKQAGKFIIDPAPHHCAETQRRHVLTALPAWMSPEGGITDDAIEHLSSLGLVEGKEAKRFWLASNPQRTQVELYTSLPGDGRQERINEFTALLNGLRLEMPFSLEGFTPGPISLAQDRTFTAYLRPSGLSAIAAVTPRQMHGFLGIFADRDVGARGILISVKFTEGRYAGIKIDLCAHCVTPDAETTANAANALGRLSRDEAITIPATARVAFWGASHDGEKLRYYIYAIPAPRDEQTSRARDGEEDA